MTERDLDILAFAVDELLMELEMNGPRRFADGQLTSEEVNQLAQKVQELARVVIQDLSVKP